MWVASSGSVSVTNSSVTYTPPSIFELGGIDYFSEISAPVRNLSTPMYTFSVIGNESFWNKTNYGNRKNVIELHAFGNESASFMLSAKYGNDVSFDVYFSEGAMGSNGIVGGYTFRYKNNEIFILNGSISFQTGVWYRIVLNRSNSLSFYKQIETDFLYTGSLSSVDNQSIRIEITSVYEGIPLYIDAPIYWNDTNPFTLPVYEKWEVPKFLGKNATEATIQTSFNLSDSPSFGKLWNGHRILSEVIMIFRNPFRANPMPYILHISKVKIGEDFVVLYSGNGSEWKAIGMGDKVSVKIRFFVNICLPNVFIDDYNVENLSPFLEPNVTREYAFIMIHEGFISDTFSFSFMTETDGYLPEVQYRIDYSHQTSPFEHAWIEVYANNTDENISGIYRADGGGFWRIHGGHAKAYAPLLSKETEMDFIVILYALDGRLVTKVPITLYLMYIRGNRNWLSDFIITRWYIFVIVSVAPFGFAFIRNKRKNARSIPLPPSPHKNIKTFYPLIGEVPNGCYVKNDKLVCKKKKS